MLAHLTPGRVPRRFTGLRVLPKCEVVCVFLLAQALSRAQVALSLRERLLVANRLGNQLRVEVLFTLVEGVRFEVDRPVRLVAATVQLTQHSMLAAFVTQRDSETHAKPLSIIFSMNATTSGTYSLTRVNTSAGSTCSRDKYQHKQGKYVHMYSTHVVLKGKQVEEPTLRLCMSSWYSASNVCASFREDFLLRDVRAVQVVQPVAEQVATMLVQLAAGCVT